MLHISNELLVLHLLFNEFELLFLELKGFFVLFKLNLVLLLLLLNVVSVLLLLQLSLLLNFINSVFNSLLLQVEVALELESSVLLPALLLLEPLVLGYLHLFHFDVTHLICVLKLSHKLGNLIFGLIETLGFIGFKVCNSFVESVLSLFECDVVIYIELLNLSCIVLIFTELAL